MSEKTNADYDEAHLWAGMHAKRWAWASGPYGFVAVVELKDGKLFYGDDVVDAVDRAREALVESKRGSLEVVR